MASLTCESWYRLHWQLQPFTGSLLQDFWETGVWSTASIATIKSRKISGERILCTSRSPRQIRLWQTALLMWMGQIYAKSRNKCRKHQLPEFVLQKVVAQKCLNGADPPPPPPWRRMKFLNARHVQYDIIEAHLHPNGLATVCYCFQMVLLFFSLSDWLPEYSCERENCHINWKQIGEAISHRFTLRSCPNLRPQFTNL